MTTIGTFAPVTSVRPYSRYVAMLRRLRKIPRAGARTTPYAIAKVDPSHPDHGAAMVSYDLRNALVYVAIATAVNAGYRVGFAPDTEEPGWVVAYIDLPTGQVSWHLPEYPAAWDGHTTVQKYERIAAFAAPAPPRERNHHGLRPGRRPVPRG